MMQRQAIDRAATIGWSEKELFFEIEKSVVLKS